MNQLFLPRNLTIIYLLLAISYLIAMPLGPYPIQYLHKAMPILCLLFFVLPLKGKIRYLAILAILFSAMGDILLALTFKDNFTFGLASFLTAHIFYFSLLIQWRSWHRWKTIPLIATLIIMTFMSYIIIPHSGALAIPVSVYIVAILGLMTAALSAEQKGLGIIFTGAVIFALSDSLIAINKFVSPVPYEGLLIMFTYYLAQLLIIVGIRARISHD